MKNCTNCGKENLDEAVFCAGCGTPLPAADAPAAEPVATEPVATETPAPAQTTDYSAYTAPAASAAPAGETKNKATLWLILNIVSTVLCCGTIFSIIGIVMAAMGMSAYKKGDYEDMNKKSKIAMIMFIIGTVLGVILEIVLIATGVLASIANAGY